MMPTSVVFQEASDLPAFIQIKRAAQVSDPRYWVRGPVLQTRRLRVHLDAAVLAPRRHRVSMPQVAENARETRAGELMSDIQWLARNLEWIQERHPGQWIAVFRGSIAAVAPTYEDLRSRVREQGVQSPLVTEIPDEPGPMPTAL